MRLRKGEEYITRTGYTAKVMSVELNMQDRYVAMVLIGGIMMLPYDINGKYINGTTVNKKCQHDLVCLAEDLEAYCLKEGYTYENKNNNFVRIVEVTKNKDFLNVAYGYELMPDGAEQKITYSIFGDYDMNKQHSRDLYVLSPLNRQLK